MHKKTWKRLGEITVVRLGGRETYRSLDDAVSAVGEPYISRLRGDRPVSELYWSLIGGDSHIFYDELGLRIPVWKIRETYANLPNVYGYPYWRWCGGVRHRRSRRGPTGVLAQRIANESLAIDNEELDGYRPMVTRRTPAVSQHMWVMWDFRGMGNYKDRSWKRHRKTQWK